MATISLILFLLLQALSLVFSFSSSSSVHSLRSKLPPTTSISNSCIGKEDGDYWLLLSPNSQTPVSVRCSNEYIILDINKEPQLTSYFTSFEKWHYAIGGPSNNNPVNWQEWFLPETEDSNANSKYLLSPSCDTCDIDGIWQVFGDKTSYWMSGNLARLSWSYVGYNDCDMDKDSYECYNCQGCKNNDSPVCNPTPMANNATDWTVTGICATAIQPSNSIVQRSHSLGMLHRTGPHFKPSIGTDGRFCVCYQPSQQNSKEYELTSAQRRYIINKNSDKSDKIDQNSENSAINNVISAKNGRNSENNSDKSDKNDRNSENSVNMNGSNVKNGRNGGNSRNMDNMSDDLRFKSNLRVDGHEMDVINSENKNDGDLRDINFIYLSQRDFEFGTYRIVKSGTYIITEDIIFDFNKDNDYWPQSDQNDEYPGSGRYRDAYFMGFFAGITVESDYVTIDLNGFELKQSLHFYYQQRWFAIIELGSQQFLPGQGPGFFGPEAINIRDCVIKDGTLGLTSHFGIHGNFAQKFTLENVHIRDFVTHGMQLNGWSDLLVKNVEIGPSSEIEYLKGDYGHGRLIIQRLRALENDLILDGTINDKDKKILFDGRGEGQEPQTVTDIANELELQMELALNWAINRVQGHFEENNYLNPKLLDFSKFSNKNNGKNSANNVVDKSSQNSANKVENHKNGYENDANKEYLEYLQDLERWERAKDLFIHESGLPSASSITGLFLNFDGASVFTYTKYTTHQSKNGKLINLYIHDLKHEMFESMRTGASKGIYGTSRMYTSPWLTDLPAQQMFGSKEKLMEFRDIIIKYENKFDKNGRKIDYRSYNNDNSNNGDSSNENNDEFSEIRDKMRSFKYIGSAMTDAYIALGTFSENWDYLGQEMLYQIDDNTNIKHWATGAMSAQPYWRFGCNQDVMIHSGKGILGLRIDGINNLEIENLVIENLYDMTALGSNACGEYKGSSRLTGTGEGGHVKQQAPIQIGFSGNNVQGVSIISSNDILFKGEISINNILSDYGEGSAISVWTASKVTFASDSLVIIKNIQMGKKLDHNSYEYDSLPNRSPEACALRLESDESSVLYDSSITFMHLDDVEDTGNNNVFVCNVNGHEKCLGEEINGNTLFGTYLSDDSNVCDEFKLSYLFGSGINDNNDKNIVRNEADNSYYYGYNSNVVTVGAGIGLLFVIYMFLKCVDCSTRKCDEYSEYHEYNEIV